MAKRINLKKLGVLLPFTLFSVIGVSAQESNSPEEKDFRITIRTHGRIIDMTCAGCAWKNLSFTLLQSEVQAVDQFGMTDLNTRAPATDPDTADFKFTISRSSKGVALRGVKGMP